MLVLSRKHNEQIVIGENIVITVIRVQGDKVRLGIEAPGDVNIRRSELPPDTKFASATPASKPAIEETKDGRTS